MKIIRFFLSNIMLIAFFCGVIYVYYYWENLTGKDTPVGQAVAYLSKEFKAVNYFVEGIKQKQSSTEVAVVEEVATQTASNMKAEKSLASKENVPTNVSINVPTNIPAGGDVFVTPEIEESLNRAMSQSVDSQSVDSQSVDSQPVISQSVTDRPEITQARIPANIPRAATSSVAAKPDVTKSDAMDDRNRELWIKARKAFYTRNFEESISSYEQLIAGGNDNFDAYGELGNVYFNQGRKTDAAASYYEAAVILVRIGQTRRAGSLMPLLHRLDAEKASQLKELISSGQS